MGAELLLSVGPRRLPSKLQLAHTGSLIKRFLNPSQELLMKSCINCHSLSEFGGCRRCLSGHRSYRPNLRKQECLNCKITETPLCRRDVETNAFLCNACGLYLKTHSRHRPVDWKSTGIKRRRRKTLALFKADGSTRPIGHRRSLSDSHIQYAAHTGHSFKARNEAYKLHQRNDLGGLVRSMERLVAFPEISRKEKLPSFKVFMQSIS